MKKEVKNVMDAIYGQKKLGVKVVDVVIPKTALKEVRSQIKDRFTEAKLIYRNGAYVMTVICDNVKEDILMYMGFKKWDKEVKKNWNDIKRVDFSSVKA